MFLNVLGIAGQYLQRQQFTQIPPHCFEKVTLITIYPVLRSAPKTKKSRRYTYIHTEHF